MARRKVFAPMQAYLDRCERELAVARKRLASSRRVHRMHGTPVTAAGVKIDLTWVRDLERCIRNRGNR